ncbi:hypothetical protein BST81_21075 [Leptolyngbya sp. 'hensonii']|uniref:hypothetical protein n=1 Tax=Leptolyngbya sp. 'hensonii' TaxID=1922337 RepID=UPI00094FF737|nr:hypothetical protein [Leptolyngbya sp. 'hensonii']OLP16473.1 hypothetical protein BST81_21075 [Leptolyngbya sp. 'hensonii']
MKITERTATQLKIGISMGHWVIFGILFGLPFLKAGLLVLATIGRYVTLDCHRAQSAQPVACEVRTIGLGWMETKPVVGIPKSAIVKPAPSGKNIYTVVITTDHQSVSLTPAGADQGSSYGVANGFTSFLNNPEQRSFQASQASFGLGFGLIFTLVGAGFILTALIYPLPYFCDFDKTTGQMILKKRSPLLGRKQTTYLLRDIQGATWEGKPDRGARTYQLNVRLRDGQALPLSAANSFSQKEFRTMAHEINQFLRE